MIWQVNTKIWQVDIIIWQVMVEKPNKQTNGSITYKKHIDASVKERPQTLLVPSEEIFKRVLCNKHI